MEIDISNAVIETPRLTMRPWALEDLDDFFAYASVEGVGEMGGWKHHKSKDESLQILRMFIEEKNVFAVVLRETDKAIGSLGLHHSWTEKDEEYKHLNSVEIGYGLSKDYWGRGLTPEAVRAAISYCFDTLGADAIACCHFVDNSQSRRVIEKCGFTYVKHGEFYARQLDREIDDVKYILLKSN